ncbi:uncharacterized protein I303_106622 [Kwoniella dejecticola CBS 10117]|uniref:DAGKc domain-containing protein n=1 Tax=Kwoniella dejecticola CBS 10117 TaxID=1296121 RepID=A0A1A5ZU63_9TREE|nr:uncharacterized protein I303_08119 [Kwoniella dejecticola CBS 10117]OBR81349.1 hypothetical protein I303_08119 [Kwoniella dejecticola CBS 10117]
MAGPLHLIVNPVAGHGKASEFVNSTVLPILENFSTQYEIHTTTSPGNAGVIGKRLASTQGNGTVQVAIVGGDGTFHEFIEGVNQIEGVRWEVVLFPFGTANALFSSLFPPSGSLDKYQAVIDTLPSAPVQETAHQLSSLFSFLSKSSPVNLPITRTTITSTSEQHHEKIVSHVLLSTSLHASILHDSEALRETHPGVERFKNAAQQNASKLFYATVSLESGANVEQWDPRIDKWVQPFTTTQPSEGEGVVRIEGPFSYFLSTSTVDRLEPTFVISPLTQLGQFNDAQGYVYVTIIRPLRDPLITTTQPEERKAKLSARAFEVVGQAYANGNHVNLTLPLKGDKLKLELENKGEGEPVVEVFRCTSFAWTPSSPSEGEYEGLERGNERLVCADGALHTIPQGGVAMVKLQEKRGDQGFYVYT